MDIAREVLPCDEEIKQESERYEEWETAALIESFLSFLSSTSESTCISTTSPVEMMLTIYCEILSTHLEPKLVSKSHFGRSYSVLT
jgi:hypothetical protein